LEFKKNIFHQKISFITWAVFLVTVIVTLISLTSAVFPALVLTSFGEFDNQIGIDPLETGIWTFPLLATNLIILVIGVLYKKKLPNIIKKSINFIFKFEVSPQIAFFVITILIGFYIIFTVEELFNGYYQPDYGVRVKSWIDNYTVSEIGEWGLGYHVMVFFLKSSVQIFDNDKVIPFLANIALLIITYVLTTEITKKRFAGIVAMVIVLQSGIFLMYDTSVSYPNFWILFYLLSLYFIIKKDYLSPISYIVALLSKILTAAFLPMTLFFIYRSNFPRQKKIKILMYYGVTLITFLSVVFLSGASFSTTEFDEEASPMIGGEKTNIREFWAGFTAFYSSFRLDGLVLLFMLPCIIGLFFASRNGIPHADSIMFMIFLMLFSAPILPGLTDAINTPYRFLPLVVFFAMGVGVLLSKRVKVGS